MQRCPEAALGRPRPRALTPSTVHSPGCNCPCSGSRLCSRCRTASSCRRALLLSLLPAAAAGAPAQSGVQLASGLPELKRHAPSWPGKRAGHDPWISVKLHVLQTILKRLSELVYRPGSLQVTAVLPPSLSILHLQREPKMHSSQSGSSRGQTLMREPLASRVRSSYSRGTSYCRRRALRSWTAIAQAATRWLRSADFCDCYGCGGS